MAFGHDLHAECTSCQNVVSWDLQKFICGICRSLKIAACALCRLSKIRMGLGRALKARNVPRLEFRFNQMSASQAAVEQEFERIAKLEGD